MMMAVIDEGDTDTMKFLLTAINAKYIHSNPAIYSLRAYAGKEYEKYIALAEFTINERTEDILEKIVEEKPDVIGISCYIWNMNAVDTLLREIPKVLPETKLWLGGPEVSFNADQVLEKHPQLTGVMIGEGEETFQELLDFYVRLEAGNAAKADIENIPGLCLGSGYTAPRAPMDLSDIPFLYEDMEPFANRIIYYESSRGCPYSCSYCLSSIDKKVRLRRTDIVEKELQFFLDHQVKQVKFVDRTFNCNREHTRRIWTYLREHDNGITNFHFEVSADILNDEEIALLGTLRPGLVQLEIGVQSTNPETIKAIKRVMDVEKLAGIVARIKAGNNVHQHLDLIVGLPFEDYASFGRSFDRVYAMQPDQLQMGFLKMLKGSYMYEHGAEYGIVYTDVAPYEVLYTNWVSYEEVRRLKRIEEMVELYYNSNQYTHTLPFLVQFFDGAFACFAAMAEFYQTRGYFVQTPARSYRYEVLREFGETVICGQTEDAEQAREQMQILREMLTFDLYLRENAKSRPGFAADRSEPEIKERIRTFYQKEEETRAYLPDYPDMDWKQLSRQTHLEYFTHPVWTKDWEEKGEYAVLFDYRSRSALNHEARVVVL